MKKQTIDVNSSFTSEELEKLKEAPPLTEKEDLLLRRLANFLIDKVLDDKKKGLLKTSK